MNKCPLGTEAKFDEPLVSVVTVCFNSERTITRTIESVNSQTYTNIEHIFVDGGSSDATTSLIAEKSLRRPTLVSETDEGIYDAMNKGFRLSGGDLVCFLNSDDAFSDEKCVRAVVDVSRERHAPFYFGGIVMTDLNGAVIRKWVVESVSFKPKVFQPQLPHPGMFFKRQCLEEIEGPYDTTMRISADLKLQLQLVNADTSEPVYVDRELVVMLVGGVSTRDWRSRLVGWSETAKGWRDVHGGTGLLFLAQKVVRKLRQMKKWRV